MTATIDDKAIEHHTYRQASLKAPQLDKPYNNYMEEQSYLLLCMHAGSVEHHHPV